MKTKQIILVLFIFSTINLFGAQYLTRINPMLTTFEQLAAAQVKRTLPAIADESEVYIYGMAIGNRSDFTINLAALTDTENLCPEFLNLLSQLPNNEYFKETHQHLVTKTIPPRHLGVLAFFAHQQAMTQIHEITFSTNLTDAKIEQFELNPEFPVEFSEITFYEDV